MILYLRCHNNNKAETAFTEFSTAINVYGMPSRVRTDKGMENAQIAWFMLQRRGPDRGSIIAGRSVHNQRIERLWRDVFSGCVSLFYRLFYFLEEHGLLDPTDEKDLFSLHYVYLPRINKQLSLFQRAWNCKPLSTERNKTPMQLWISGILKIQNSDYTVAREFCESEPPTEVCKMQFTEMCDFCICEADILLSSVCVCLSVTFSHSVPIQTKL